MKIIKNKCFKLSCLNQTSNSYLYALFIIIIILLFLKYVKFTYTKSYRIYIINIVYNCMLKLFKL